MGRKGVGAGYWRMGECNGRIMGEGKITVGKKHELMRRKMGKGWEGIQRCVGRGRLE